MSQLSTHRKVAAIRGLAELAEHASALSSALAVIAELVKQLARGLVDADGHLAERDAAVAIAELDSASVNVSAWVGVLVLESPVVRRWQRVLLLEALRTRGIHRDLTDLPSTGGASAGGRLAVAARRAGSDPSNVLVHSSRWALEPFASVPTASDASLLAWTLEPEDLDWLEERCHGGPLEQVVGLASWLQAVESDRNPGPAPDTDLTWQWFECRGFRGPRRQLARRRGTAAGRRGVSECESWLSVAAASQNASRTPVLGQATLTVEWAIATARAWPDRETLVRINDPSLRTRAEHLRSTVAACVGDAADAPLVLEWFDSAVRGLTVARETSRTVHGNRADVAAHAPARSI